MLNVKPSWKNWQLFTEKGRHIWAFKPSSNNINYHLQNAEAVSDQEIAQFQEDFLFDKENNPNSGDNVFRASAIAVNFHEFTGRLPRLGASKAQKIADRINHHGGI